MFFDAFRTGLSDRGYAAGSNLILEARYGDGMADRVPALTQELLRIPVDAIVTQGMAKAPEFTDNVRHACSQIPCWLSCQRFIELAQQTAEFTIEHKICPAPSTGSLERWYKVEVLSIDRQILGQMVLDAAEPLLLLGSE